MTVEVGQQAPDFALRDQKRETVRLSDYRGGKVVVVVFYPYSFSRICGGELCDLRDDVTAFQNDDVQLLAVSVDSPYVQRAWAGQQRYTFPLLADFWPHGQVARAYGVFDDEIGAALRGSFVIDRDGVLRWKTLNQVPDARDLDDYKQALAGLT